jgi:hypothetical protein
LLFSRQFICWPAVDLFRRKRRWHLLETSYTLGRKFLKLCSVKYWRAVGALRFAVGVVCVGSEAEPEAGGVALAAARIKLNQPCGPPKKQDKNPRRQGIKGPKVPDLTKACQMAYCIDYIVGGFSLRLVDDQSAVERRRLWLARHASPVVQPEHKMMLGKRSI